MSSTFFASHPLPIRFPTRPSLESKIKSQSSKSISSAVHSLLSNIVHRITLISKQGGLMFVTKTIHVVWTVKNTIKLHPFLCLINLSNTQVQVAGSSPNIPPRSHAQRMSIFNHFQYIRVIIKSTSYHCATTPILSVKLIDCSSEVILRN